MTQWFNFQFKACNQPNPNTILQTTTRNVVDVTPTFVTSEGVNRIVMFWKAVSCQVHVCVKGQKMELSLIKYCQNYR